MSNETRPSLPSGTRDFDLQTMAKRNFLFDVIKNAFKSYGFSELQTPAIEQLSTLTGKYGEEGDQLIFKILNSGDFLRTVNHDVRAQSSKEMVSLIAEKALRYDLTIPFARYIAMNRGRLTLPFKRYQIQPVWRADRPQKGRYREFYQCDADIIGSTSVVCEAELLSIYAKVFSNLGLTHAVIQINHRKILQGISEVIGREDLFLQMVTALDKIEKIGAEGVKNELLAHGFSPDEILKLSQFWSLEGSNEAVILRLEALLAASVAGSAGINEVKKILGFYFVTKTPIKIRLSVSLARGLSYYSGAIFEAVIKEAPGSLGGGGRYDNLTSIFGVKEPLGGVGISFGADRIYDVMEELGIFPNLSLGATVMIANFYEDAEPSVWSLATAIRGQGIDCLLFPDLTKLDKQLKFASKNNIKKVILVGEKEHSEHSALVKDMTYGSQTCYSQDELIHTPALYLA